MLCDLVMWLECVLCLSVSLFVLLCVVFPVLKWHYQVLLIGICVLVAMAYLVLLFYIMCVHVCSVLFLEESDPLLREPEKPNLYVVVINANHGLSVGVDPM